MKVLSLWQPWATLIAIGAKRIETRGWQTNHTGLLLIHAAKIRTEEGYHEFSNHEFSNHVRLFQDAGYNSFTDLPFGCVVALTALMDCVPTKYLGSISYLERSVGNYDEGRFGWILDQIHRIDTPVPLTGRQGLFTFKGDYDALSPMTFIPLRASAPPREPLFPKTHKIESQLWQTQNPTTKKA